MSRVVALSQGMDLYNQPRQFLQNSLQCRFGTELKFTTASASCLQRYIYALTEIFESASPWDHERRRSSRKGPARATSATADLETLHKYKARHRGVRTRKHSEAWSCTFRNQSRSNQRELSSPASNGTLPCTHTHAAALLEVPRSCSTGFAHY